MPQKCHKNPKNTACFDFILINVPRIFKSASVIDTGQSVSFPFTDVKYHQMYLLKQQPKIIKYWYTSIIFMNFFVKNVNEFEFFCEITMNTVNMHEPHKKHYTKELKENILKKIILKYPKGTKSCSFFKK